MRQRRPDRVTFFNCAFCKLRSSAKRSNAKTCNQNCRSSLSKHKRRGMR